MNVSTTSQTVNITEPFTVEQGHAYTLLWKAGWYVNNGTWTSPNACVVGSVTGLPGVSGNFYSPILGQTIANTDDGEYLNFNTSFINNTTSAQSIQFTVRTVDYPFGSTNPSNFSSIVQQLVESEPILIDFGPTA